MGNVTDDAALLSLVSSIQSTILNPSLSPYTSNNHRRNLVAVAQGVALGTHQNIFSLPNQ